MKNFSLVLFAAALMGLAACGEQKADQPAAAPATTETTTTAPAPAAETVVDTVEAALDATTKELEERTANMKKALENL